MSGREEIRQRRGDREPAALLLLGLPAQHLDQGPRRLPRLCRHRLPLHGPVDGPRDARLHPHGRRRARTGSANPPSPHATTSSRTSATAPTTTPASRRSAPRSASDANITYKILFNDAVAMTGGQHNDGDLNAPQIARELMAMGVQARGRRLRRRRRTWTRTPSRAAPTCTNARNCLACRRNSASIKGVSAIVYIQTCAAEKRRRRKRGHVPRPRQARLHQHRRLRRLRRLRRPVELRLHRARGNRTRPQARDRPVLLQQGLLLPERLLPVLRHARRREDPQRPRRRRVDLGRPPRTRPARDPRHPQRRHHRRRRHRRRHRRRDPRHGRASRRQGRGHDGDGGPGPEGRGRPRPLPPRRRARRTSARSASPSAKRCARGRRPRRQRGRQDARPDEARAAPARSSTATRSSPATSPATPNSASPPTGSRSRSRRACATASSSSTPPNSPACSWAIRSTPT